MKTYKDLVASVLIFSGMVSGADDHVTPKVISADSIVSIKTTKEWILGTNLWIGVEIKNTRNNKITGPVFESSPFGFYGYSYRMRDAKSGEIVLKKDYLSPPLLGEVLYDEDGQPAGIAMPPTYDLKSDGELRLLFPIDFPVDAVIPPGNYRFALTIHSLVGELGRSSFTVAARNPSNEEAQLLKELELGSGQSIFKAKNLKNVSLSKSLKENTGIEFELVVSDLVRKNKTVGEINEKDIIEGIREQFFPELQVIRYEVLKTKGMMEEAEKIRNEILKKNPGLQFRFETIDAGYGPVKELIGNFTR